VTFSYFNDWLDEYNDYMRLYQFFGDPEYLDEAREILRSLRAMVRSFEYHQYLVSKVLNNEVHI
jgi:hypothetical protein